MIPAYNAEPFIEEAIQSALDQTYEDTIVCVTDDGSIDNTAKIIKKLAKKNKRLLTHFFKKNKGNPYAMNKSGEMALEAGCNAVMIFSADDVLLPHAVGEAVGLLNDKIFVSLGVEYFGNAEGTRFAYTGWSYPRQVLGGKNNFVGFSLIQADIWKYLGGYDEELFIDISKSSWEDWDLHASMLRLGEYAVTPTVCVKYRIHPGQSIHGLPAIHKELRERFVTKHLKELEKYPESFEILDKFIAEKNGNPI